MAKKNILLADADGQTLEDFCQAMGEEWNVAAVSSGTAALTHMEKETADVIVADLDLAELDGAELLNRIQTTYPKTVRFILAREADHERMVKQVLGAHQFIEKPLNPSTLKATVERAMALENWLPKQSIRELVARIRTLPTIPSLYLEVQAALRSPDATTEQIGGIIAKDMAMMTKLLQVLNSACFGLPRKITNPTEAVGILGFETVNSMVMTIKLLSQYDKVKPVYFSIDRLWRHSTEVARSAKQITMWHTEDPVMAETAFTGALLHDLGKVVLASNFDEQYRGAQNLAKKQDLPPWDVEKEIFGASHGEIGAYLLGLWGMPLDLHEIAAFHHHPQRSIVGKFTALTAVHIANALEYEANPDKEGLPMPKIDEEYLAQLGVLDCLGGWRQAILKNESTPGSEGKTTFISANVVRPSLPTPGKAPAQKAPPPVPKPVAAGKPSVFSNPWLYGGVGIAAAVLVLGWLGVQMLGDKVEKAANNTDPASVATAPAQTPAPTPAPTAPQTQPVAVAEANPQPQPIKLDTARPADPSVSVVAKPKAPDTMVAAKPPVKPGGFPDMKLQGIIFSDTPSAIINGKRVQANDHVNGALVRNITSTTVVLEYQNHLKTLVLQ